MNGILSDIIGLLTGGITEMAQAIGQGLSNLAKNIFLVPVGTGADLTYELSIYGTLIVIFAGISLCIGLSRYVVGWLSTLSARK